MTNGFCALKGFLFGSSNSMDCGWTVEYIFSPSPLFVGILCWKTKSEGEHHAEPEIGNDPERLCQTLNCLIMYHSSEEQQKTETSISSDSIYRLLNMNVLIYYTARIQAVLIAVDR